jgi:hypothetical protein
MTLTYEYTNSYSFTTNELTKLSPREHPPQGELVTEWQGRLQQTKMDKKFK